MGKSTDYSCGACGWSGTDSAGPNVLSVFAWETLACTAGREWVRVLTAPAMVPYGTGSEQYPGAYGEYLDGRGAIGCCPVHGEPSCLRPLSAPEYVGPGDGEVPAGPVCPRCRGTLSAGRVVRRD